VNSSFILTELHRHNQYIWAGSTTHHLIAENGGFKITYKKVVLLNNNEALPNMLFLLNGVCPGLMETILRWY
jgi:hypothetical protein